MTTESEQVRILRENELLKARVKDTENRWAKQASRDADEIAALAGQSDARLELMSRLGDKLEQAQARVAGLETLVDAQSQLLAAYRLGSHKLADTALTRIEKAKAALAKGDSNATD